MKKLSKILLSSGIAACMVTGAFASPTGLTTNSLFNTDADKMLDVLGFSDVEFENGIANVDLGNKQYHSTTLNASAAFDAFGLYWGVNYDGFLLNGTNRNNTSVNTVEAEGTGTNAGKVNVTDKTTTVVKSTDLNSSWNFGSFLLGIGNLGIKTNVWVTNGSKSDNGSGDVTHEEVNGIDAPTTISKTKNTSSDRDFNTSLEIGLPIELGDNTLSLKAGLGAQIKNDKKLDKTETYKWYNNKQGDLISTSYTDNNSGYFTLKPTLYVGMFNAYVDYDGSFGFYEKSAKDASGNKIKTKGYSSTKSSSTYVSSNGVATTVDSTTVNYNPLKSENSHNVTFGYNNTKELNEKLSVGYGLSTKVAMSFNKAGTNSTANQSAKTIRKYDYSNAAANSVPAVYVTEVVSLTETTDNKTVSTKDITVTPTLSLAAQYAVKPNVKINFGYKATGDAFNSNIVKTTYSSESPKTVITSETKYSDGTVIKEKTVPANTSDTRTETNNVTNTFGVIKSSFATGITFDLTENMTLDSTMNFGKNSSDGYIGLSSLDKIFADLTVSATVRF